MNAYRSMRALEDLAALRKLDGDALYREHRTNLRELRRLRLKLATGQTGRNRGATEAAYERRLDRDREILAALAAAEAREEEA